MAKDIRTIGEPGPPGLRKAWTVLFDEIHRFNRAQQDVLLNDGIRGPDPSPPARIPIRDHCR
jgi:hypothetical protein